MRTQIIIERREFPAGLGNDDILGEPKKMVNWAITNMQGQVIITDSLPYALEVIEQALAPTPLNGK